MTQEDEITADPFQDPSATASQHDGVEDATLVVGRDASLTLGTDSLVVLGLFYYRMPLRLHKLTLFRRRLDTTEGWCVAQPLWYIAASEYIRLLPNQKKTS